MRITNLEKQILISEIPKLFSLKTIIFKSQMICIQILQDSYYCLIFNRNFTLNNLKVFSLQK